MTPSEEQLRTLLEEVALGRRSWRANIVYLLKRDWVEPNGLYDVRLTDRGRLALRGVIDERAPVRVTQQHRYTPWRDQVVRLVRITKFKSRRFGVPELLYEQPGAFDETKHHAETTVVGESVYSSHLEQLWGASFCVFAHPDEVEHAGAKALFVEFNRDLPEEKRPVWEKQPKHIQWGFIRKALKGGFNHPAGRSYRVRRDGTAYSFATMVSPERHGLRDYRFRPNGDQARIERLEKRINGLRRMALAFKNPAPLAVVLEEARHYPCMKDKGDLTDEQVLEVYRETFKVDPVCLWSDEHVASAVKDVEARAGSIERELKEFIASIKPKPGPHISPDPDNRPPAPEIPEGFTRVYVFGFDLSTVVDEKGKEHVVEINKASRTYLVPVSNPRKDHEPALARFRTDFPRERTGWRYVRDDERICLPEETIGG